MNKEIDIKDKIFEIFISEDEISSIVHSMANQINNSGVKDPLFIAVLNGSFLFAADIMRKINIPNCEISFIKLSSYLGTENTGKVNELIGLGKNIRNRNIVILEDIIDTGAQNTIDIEVGCITSGIAADICANYTDGTYSDWFLPSKDELNLMHAVYSNGNVANLNSNYYWSSTEVDGDYAWSQSFTSGVQYSLIKNYTFYVRAVRAF